MDFKKNWKNILKRLGIRSVRFHDLRPTFASHFLMKGGDLYTLKEILGHKDITITSRYLTITTEHKNKALFLNKRIVLFLSERVAKVENPRSIGAPLKGPIGQYWKYRGVITGLSVTSRMR